MPMAGYTVYTKNNSKAYTHEHAHAYTRISTDAFQPNIYVAVRDLKSVASWNFA